MHDGAHPHNQDPFPAKRFRDPSFGPWLACFGIPILLIGICFGFRSSCSVPAYRIHSSTHLLIHSPAQLAGPPYLLKRISLGFSAKTKHPFHPRLHLSCHPRLCRIIDGRPQQSIKINRKNHNPAAPILQFCFVFLLFAFCSLIPLSIRHTHHPIRTAPPAAFAVSNFPPVHKYSILSTDDYQPPTNPHRAAFWSLPPSSFVLCLSRLSPAPIRLLTVYQSPILPAEIRDTRYSQPSMTAGPALSVSGCKRLPDNENRVFPDLRESRVLLCLHTIIIPN